MIKRAVSCLVAVCLACAVLCGCDYSDYDWDFPLEEKNEALIAEAEEESAPPEDYVDRLAFVHSEIENVVNTGAYKRA